MSDTRERIYCVNCAHFRLAESGAAATHKLEFGRCTNFPKEVDGSQFVAPEFNTREFHYAALARTAIDMCGPDATKFEAKPAAVEAA